MGWFAAWTFLWGSAGWEPGLGQEAWAAVEGTRLPWGPGLERTQLLIGLAVEIQVTFEGRWTGDSGAAVLEETAAAVGVRLFVEAEILVAGAVHLKGACRHKCEEMHVVGNKHRTSLWKDGFANRRDSSE